MKRKCRKDKNIFTKSFTLVELLIVVSIMAILMAILFPALSTARNQAKAIKCVNNKKQIGLIFAMYSQEQNDFMPTWRWGGASVYERWYQAIYLSGHSKMTRLDQYLGCPTPEATGGTVTKGETLAYNMRLADLKIFLANTPSKKFLVGDCSAGYWFREDLTYRISSNFNPASSSTYGFYPWHNKLTSGSMLYLDGHANLLKVVNLDIPSADGWWFMTYSNY